jgi:hypothetical protein
MSRMVTRDIDDLKKAINNMLLWKLNTPIPVSKFERDASSFDSKGAVQCLRLTDTTGEDVLTRPSYTLSHKDSVRSSQYLILTCIQ